MKIFAFDLLAYPERLDHLNVEGRLPYPLPGRHFRPEVAAENYREHLEAWAYMDQLGFDGVGFNEHHTSPYGLMNSPNLMAAAASQITKRLKILIYGNALPIHEPLRLAEELAMADCMSGGRIISGFVRGIPREYMAYNMDMAESRARFEEAWEIIKLAWTEDVFSYEGKFWSYKDVAIWPRPLQQPHPPVWVPVTGSKETIEWAAKHNFPITPGETATPGVREDVTRYYAECLASHGHAITPDHLVGATSVYVSESKEQAAKEAGPSWLYFVNTLFGHGSIRDPAEAKRKGYLTEAAYDYMRPEVRDAYIRSRETTRTVTLDDAVRGTRMPWGNPDEVREVLIKRADMDGTNTMLLTLNTGGLPHELFMRNLKRFGEEVLPALQEHQVTAVPAAFA